MPIKIKRNKFVECGTGISAPETADVDIDENEFRKTGEAVEIRKNSNGNKNSDIFKLSPEFHGIGINLKNLWCKLKKFFKK
ncbi:MAG: hypothetical protein Q8P99_02870 [bacterium]|nr:hypothetical protein [bacterium]